jgi:alkylation response protein AidB-like acyl-CoA dehydrogenase
MNFDLNDDQQLLRDTIDRMFEAHAAAPHNSAAEWDAYRDIGLLAIPFPAALDGLDAGHEAVMLTMEAYGRTLARAPYLQSVLMAGRVLADAGGSAAHDALSAMLAGRSRPALCLFEPRARYRWDAPNTTAVRTEAGWTLRGEKVAVLNGDDADLLICPAMTAEGVSLLLVPAETPGVSRNVRPTPDGRSAADISFADVTLASDAAIGDPATNSALLEVVVDGAMAACCAEAVGAMERLLAITTQHLNTRPQFGAFIGSFQALQHRAADMLTAMEQARSMTFYAVSMLDAPAAERRAAVAGAKALVNRAARFVGSEAIQLHGGMGMASEYPAGRYFQRLTVIETMFGDTDHLLAMVEAGGGLPN